MERVIVVGGGSAGCAAAARLAESGRRVHVIEAGPTDRHPLVKAPMGLVWLMGSRRDWQRRTVPQGAAGGRTVGVPRGRCLGGSGSINSMVWFQGLPSDYDAWDVPGWSWRDVAEDAAEVARRVGPVRHPSPHPLSKAFGRVFAANDPDAPPDPGRQSAAVCHHNMRGGRRRSAADVFLRRAIRSGRVTVETGGEVDRVLLEAGRATGVRLRSGRELRGAAVVLCAGSIETPMILMRSGVGPGATLREAGIDVAVDAPGVGANLHDHPAVCLHFAGSGSGYGLSLRQMPRWAAAPLRWLATGSGPLGSPTVEACAFYAASGEGPPDIQTHFIPFMIGWRGRSIVWGEGYLADAVLCRPRSRGRLSIGHDRFAPLIDPGLLSDERDLDDLCAGVERLRAHLAAAPFGAMRAPEVHPGEGVTGAALREHVRVNVGTAYHPVGTCALHGPLDASGAVRGVAGLHVADASVMPRITTANTNAPSMMIGWRIAGMMVRAQERIAA